MPGLQGESFAAALLGKDLPPRGPIYAEAIYPERAYGWAATYALRDLAMKFIEAPEPEVYDLGLDPGERNNLAPSRAGDVDTWRSRLLETQRGFGEARGEAHDPLSTEERERLASLGYVSLPPSRPRGQARPDPKRRVAEHNAHLAARALLRQGRLPEAERALDAILEADPANPTAILLRGAVAFTLGRREEGLRRIEEAARLAPGVAEIQWTRAQTLHNLGRLPEAATGYRSFLALEPDAVRGHTALGDVLAAMGDAAGAAKAYEAAIGLGFDAPIVRAALGAALAAAGRTEEGERELHAAVGADPTLAVAWQKLGALAEQRGRLKEAVGHYAKAVEAAPENQRILLDHARLSLRTGDRETARREVERFLAGGTRDRQLDASAQALLRELE
jgi:tetratricopeptide (TPR) repeat protein